MNPYETHKTRSPSNPVRLTCGLLVVVLLGLVGGAVAERGVQPARVVEALDVVKDRAACLLERGVAAPAQALLGERGEEALLGRELDWEIRASAQRLPNASAVYWAAAIGVMDQPVAGAALADGHLKRPRDEL